MGLSKLVSQAKTRRGLKALIEEAKVDPKPRNPRWVQWARTEGKHPDDPSLKPYEFVLWIKGMWAKWDKLQGRRGSESHGKLDHDAFDGWLRREVDLLTTGHTDPVAAYPAYGARSPADYHPLLEAIATAPRAIEEPGAKRPVLIDVLGNRIPWPAPYDYSRTPDLIRKRNAYTDRVRHLATEAFDEGFRQAMKKSKPKGRKRKPKAPTGPIRAAYEHAIGVLKKAGRSLPDAPWHEILVEGPDGRVLGWLTTNTYELDYASSKRGDKSNTITVYSWWGTDPVPAVSELTSGRLRLIYGDRFGMSERRATGFGDKGISRQYKGLEQKRLRLPQHVEHWRYPTKRSRKMKLAHTEIVPPGGHVEGLTE